MNRQVRRILVDVLLYAAAIAGLFGLALLWLVEAGRSYP